MSRRVFWIATAVIALLILTTSVALAAPLNQEGEATADALWTTLAPLIAIATAIERILEAFWDRWEKAKLSPGLRRIADPESDDYIRKKKLWSHWLGTIMAIFAIGLTNVRFFHLLGFDVLFSSPDLILFDAGIGGILDDFTLGSLIDWLVTAGIIGWGGTELTHSVIEGLVKGRALWKEMREVQAGRQSITDARFFNDYVAPQLEELGIEVNTLRQAVSSLNQIGVPVDQFIGDMTAGKVTQFLGQLEGRPETAEAAQAVRTVLEGVPAEKQIEIPNVIGLLTKDQRERFLGG
jgi:hypothetical protein